MKSLLFAVSLVSQIGLVVALPAVVLGFGGAYLDKILNSSPLFILLGFALAAFGSSRLVYKLIKKVQI